MTLRQTRTVLGPAYLTLPNCAIYAELEALIAMCLLIVLMIIYIGAVWILFVGGATVAEFMATSWYLYIQEGVLLDVTYAAIAGFMTYSVLTHLNYVHEEHDGRQLRNVFAHYMSLALVEQLAENSEKLQLGDNMKKMLLLFCDVCGFIRISELYKSDPQSRLINRLLTPTNDNILTRCGTIDKYLGDCIMAFWNAPLDDEDHAAPASASAMAMMDCVSALNVTLEAEAEESRRPFIPISVGIGINTGECCAGNMGSEQRFDYLVLCDPVNLASRLEGQSKTYGMGNVISGSTFQGAKDFAAVEFDLIKVRGKDEAVRIHTLSGDLGMRHEADFQTLSECLRRCWRLTEASTGPKRGGRSPNAAS